MDIVIVTKVAQCPTLAPTHSQRRPYQNQLRFDEVTAMSLVAPVLGTVHLP